MYGFEIFRFNDIGIYAIIVVEYFGHITDDIFDKLRVVVGFFRELLGTGSVLGIQVVPQVFYDFGYVNNGLMILPPMALIAIAVIIWIHRARNKDLQED